MQKQAGIIAHESTQTRNHAAQVETAVKLAKDFGYIVCDKHINAGKVSSGNAIDEHHELKRLIVDIKTVTCQFNDGKQSPYGCISRISNDRIGHSMQPLRHQ